MKQTVNDRVGAALQRIEVSRRHRHAGVVAIENRERTSGAEHPQRLRQRLFRIGDVTQGCVKEHRIEASILVVEGATVDLSKSEVSALFSQFSCLRNEYWRGIDTESLCDLRQARNKAGYCAGTTADFKHVCFFGEGDLTDKGLEDASLQKVCCAKLQRRGQAFKGSWIGSGNLRINVWHPTSSLPPHATRRLARGPRSMATQGRAWGITTHRWRSTRPAILIYF